MLCKTASSQQWRKVSGSRQNSSGHLRDIASIETRCGSVSIHGESRGFAHRSTCRIWTFSLFLRLVRPPGAQFKLGETALAKTHDNPGRSSSHRSLLARWKSFWTSLGSDVPRTQSAECALHLCALTPKKKISACHVRLQTSEAELAKVERFNVFLRKVRSNGRSSVYKRFFFLKAMCIHRGRPPVPTPRACCRLFVGNTIRNRSC